MHVEDDDIISDAPTAKDAQEFYNYLIRRQTMDPEPHGRLLFRGLAKSEKFKLIPTALRPEGEEWLKNFEPIGDSCELGALSTFYRRATEQGLNLPRVSSSVHRWLMNPREQDAILLRAAPYGEELNELWAVAQHHGLKTKFLDWSRSSAVCMAFAARDALSTIENCLNQSGVPDIQGKLENENIAVWVLNRDGVEEMNSLLSSDDPKSGYSESAIPYRIEFVEPPTQSNKNIVAQQGAFTSFQPEIMNVASRGLENEKLALDHCIRLSVNYWCQHDRFSVDRRFFPLLERVTLPVLQVVPLLDVLQQHNWDAAELFPGFNGCADAVKDHARRKSIKARIDELKGQSSS